MGNGNIDQAHQILERAQACIQMPQYWQLLSEVLLRKRKPVAARSAALKGLKLAPDNLLGKLALAQCELGMEHEPRAIKLLREILAEQPDNQHAKKLLLGALARTGEMEEASRLLRDVLEQRPDDATLLFQATVLHLYDIPQLQVERLEQLLQQNLPPESRFTLLFTLSRVHARNGRYEQAAAALKEANRLKRQTIRKTPLNIVQSTISVISDFSREHVEPARNAGHPSTRPIFILGMPRSGTTLTEQILNQHPQVRGIGEQNIIGKLVQEAVVSLPPGGSVMEKLNAKPKRWKNMGARYLELTQRQVGQATYSADKMPLNANMVGFIRLIFPNAKIVHCKRDPYDTLLSCMQAHFNEARLAFSPEEWGMVYACYEALMEHWERLFPGEIIHLEYERLVQNPEEEIRALLDDLELPFHPDCLHPERTSATIRTASIAQVRNPINAGSVGRSREWMPWLKEVEESLEKAREQLRPALASRQDAKRQTTQ